METLAARISSRRKELGLSSTDLADLIGISLPAVLKWETGATANLKHDHLFTLADALNVNPRWLALGTGPKIASPAREAYRQALERRDVSEGRAKQVWERIAAAFAKAAMVMVIALPPLLATPPANANGAFDIKVIRNTHCVLRRWLTRLASLTRVNRNSVMV